MPTKPLESILNRDLSKVANNEFISLAAPVLVEIVNYSTNLWARCASSVKGKVNEDLAVLMLYLHMIEMSDGIEVLISKSCAAPAIPLIRSSFEALLSIEYILESDANYTRRSLAWLLEYVNNRIRLYEGLDPETNFGREFQKIWDDDELAQLMPKPDFSRARQAKDNLKKFFNHENIQQILIEHEKSKKKNRRGHQAWYQYFGGPSNLRNLAIRLKHGISYEVLYRHWSNITHANDISRFITSTDQGEAAIYGLRNPNLLQEAATFSASYLLSATRQLSEKFRPGERVDFARWYVREIKDRYLIIVGSNKSSDLFNG